MRSAACTLALVLIPSFAVATPGQYQKKTPPPVVRTVKSTLAKPKQKPKQKQLTADQFLQLQGRLQDIGNDLIEQHRGLIDETDADHEEMPDLLFRLAELCAQKQRYLRFEAMELYGKIRKARSPRNKKALAREQKRLFKQQRMWLIEAIKAYKRLADEQIGITKLSS